MKRLLYIDPYAALGHTALNQTYITALARLNLEIDLIMSPHCLEQLALPASVHQYPIPHRFDRRGGGRVSERFRDYRIYRYISENFPISGYDYVFLSSYDEIALWLSGLRGNLWLLNHANVSGLDKAIKRFCAKRLAKRARFVVFHEFIRQRCGHFGITNVTVEGQGLASPYSIDLVDRQRIMQQIDTAIARSPDTRILFAPSGAKYADTFMGRTIANPAFSHFLLDNDIQLVVKGHLRQPDNDQVRIISRDLTALEYASLFLASSCVVLSYPASFNYRVSAILLECFSNRKLSILSRIEGFTAFAPYFRYDPFFGDETEFKDRIVEALKLGPGITADPYRDLVEFAPMFLDFQTL